MFGGLRFVVRSVHWMMTWWHFLVKTIKTHLKLRRLTLRALLLKRKFFFPCTPQVRMRGIYFMRGFDWRTEYLPIAVIGKLPPKLSVKRQCNVMPQWYSLDYKNFVVTRPYQQKREYQCKILATYCSASSFFITSQTFLRSSAILALFPSFSSFSLFKPNQWLMNVFNNV